MPTLDEMKRKFFAADKAGDVEGARILKNLILRTQTQAQAPTSPTSNKQEEEPSLLRKANDYIYDNYNFNPADDNYDVKAAYDFLTDDSVPLMDKAKAITRQASRFINPFGKFGAPTHDEARAEFQGVSFNWGDEIEAAAKSLWGDKSYKENLNSIRAEIAEFKKNNPGTALTAEILGSLSTGGIGAAKAIGKYGITKGSALLGGGQGALYGAGATDVNPEAGILESIGQRAVGAIDDAAIGAGAGALLGKATSFKFNPKAKDGREVLQNALRREGVPDDEIARRVDALTPEEAFNEAAIREATLNASPKKTTADIDLDVEALRQQRAAATQRATAEPDNVYAQQAATQSDVPLKPQQESNRLLFDEYNITPASRSRITRTTKDAQLDTTLRSAEGPEGDAFRRREFDETNQIKAAGERAAESLGDASTNTLKEGVKKTINKLFTEKNVKYKNLETLSKTHAANPELREALKLNTDDFLTEVRDVKSQYTLLDDSSNSKINRLLAQYGILNKQGKLTPAKNIEGKSTLQLYETTPEGRVKVTLKPDGTQVPKLSNTKITFNGYPKQLSLANQDDFRKLLNNSFKDVTKPTDKTVAKIIREKFDEMIDGKVAQLADDVNVGNIGEELRDAAKSARAANTKYMSTKEEELLFKPLSKISKSGRDVVDISQVTKKLKNTPANRIAENYKIMVDELGPEGAKVAMSGPKSMILNEFVEKAIARGKQNPDEVGGVISGITPTTFARSMDNFGRDKLKVIFGSDYKILKDFEKIMASTGPLDGSVQRGSLTPQQANLLHKTLNVWLGGAASVVGKIGVGVADTVARGAITNAQTQRMASKAADLRPNRHQFEQWMTKYTPYVAAALGIQRPNTENLEDAINKAL